VVQQLPKGRVRQAGIVDPRCDGRLQVESEPEAEHAEIRLRDAVDEVAGGLVHAAIVWQDRDVAVDPKERERVLGTIRKICLGLPETSERLSHGAPSFFVKDKRCFAMVLTDHHGDGRFAIWCAAGDGVQGMLIEANPDRFFRPPYVGHRGWLGMRLDRGLDVDELAGILEDAYAEVAPAKLLEAATTATPTGRPRRSAPPSSA
jgi:hypothetical protein